ncbi:MAG TPA: hypothetical protein VJ913_01360 [Actinomycetota bacterium]|nr:hypothetical protein [Actinomycetota bacterium]
MSQIEATRRRLDDEFAELETYLTPTAAFAKRAAAVVGGIVAGFAFLRFVLRRRADMRETRRLRSIDERLERLEELLERSAFVSVRDARRVR